MKPKVTRTTISRVKGSNPVEWQVRAYINNEQGLPFQRYEAADYFTNDKDDAIATAEEMKK